VTGKEMTQSCLWKQQVFHQSSKDRQVVEVNNQYFGGYPQTLLMTLKNEMM
jgi:hypothetical protein